jgi:hypothetical protein
MGDRRTEEGHDAIAQHLVHRALKAVHGLHHAAQGRVQELLGGLRVDISDQFGRVFDIGEQHRDLLALTCEGGTGLQDFFGEMCGGIRERCPLLVCGEGGACSQGLTRFSGVDQATAVVIDHLWVRVQKFVLERLQVIVVQTELELEGAIGHPASPLEHDHRVIEHLLKGHGRPSTPLARVSQERNLRQGGISLNSARRVYQE